MTLTLPHGPLSAEPAHVNYRIDGPEHRRFFAPFPRRVRGELEGRGIVDTVHGMLLHETGALPQLYVPQTDTAGHLLQPSDTVADVPYKGRAHHYSVRVGDRVAPDAVWSFPRPVPGVTWLRGYHAVAWDAMDAWFDEDEQVFGHLRDPYHRVDTRVTSRRVRVLAGDRVLAESDRPVLLSETGLPNRLYVPPEDVHTDELTPSHVTTVCPYKGTADYADAAGRETVAWRYRDPLPDALHVAGYWCFDDTRVEVRADSRAVPAHRVTRDPQPPTHVGAPGRRRRGATGVRP